MALPLAAIDTGFYINPYKLIPVVLLLLVWSRLLTWIDKDSDVAHLPRMPVNLGVMGVGVLGFALFFLIPNFWASTGILFALTAGSVGGYIGLRASQIGTKDLSKQLKDFFTSFGKQKSDKGAKEIVTEFQIFDSKSRLLEAPAEEDPRRAGYEGVQTLLVDPVKKNAERIRIEPGPDGAYRLVYVVDGFNYLSPIADKGVAAAAIEFLKQSAGLDLDEKRKPQTGKLRGTTGGKKKDLEVTSSGTSAGEAVDIQIDPKTRHAFKLGELGLSDLQEAAIRDSIEVKQGIVLLAAPKLQGLTSMCYSIIRAHDAFLNHIQTIERVSTQDLEGITQVKLGAGASPAEELKQVNWVISQEPDVLMMTSIEEPASAKELIKYASTGKKAYVALRANSAIEAINLWRKMVGDDGRAMRYLIMAVSGRVVRKLCVQCKVAITPDPEQLKKLNLSPERVTQLFQERTEPMVDPKGNPLFCDTCQELRFKGRTGVYEVVIVDDEIREAVLAGGSASQLRALIRKQRMPFLQESALELIQRGDTSVKEVQRVFSATEAAAARPPASKTGVT